MKRAKPILAIILTLLAASAPAFSQERLKDPRYYLERMLEYYRSIQTVSAEFEITESKPKTQDGTISTGGTSKSYRYFKSAEKQRQEEEPKGNLGHVEVYRDNTMKIFEQNNVGPSQMGIEADKGGVGRACDGYRLFFEQIEALEAWCEKPDLLEQYDSTVKPTIESDGRQTIEVSVFAEDKNGLFFRRTFRLDPSRGYVPLVIDVESKDVGFSMHNTRIVSEYVDTGNGLWAPAQIEEAFHHERLGQVVDTCRTTRVSKAVFNQPIDDALFNLLPQPKTLVTDAVGNISYQVQGMETGDIEVPPLPTEDAGQAPTTPREKTAEPPTDAPLPDAAYGMKLLYLLAGASAVAAALAAVALVLRLRQKQTNNSPH